MPWFEIGCCCRKTQRATSNGQILRRVSSHNGTLCRAEFPFRRPIAVSQCRQRRIADLQMLIWAFLSTAKTTVIRRAVRPDDETVLWPLLSDPAIAYSDCSPRTWRPALERSAGYLDALSRTLRDS